MKNQAVLLLLAILGATSVQAADTDRELARQLALQQKNLLKCEQSAIPEPASQSAAEGQPAP